MKTWQKILVGLGIAYFTYVFSGACYNQNRVNEYRRQAVVKADVNKNGHIDPEEALKMLRETGNNTYSIFFMIPAEEKYRILEKKVLSGKKGYEAGLLRRMLREVQPYPLPKNYPIDERIELDERIDKLNEITWAVLTKNADRSSNLEKVKKEIETAFCEAYRGKYLDDITLSLIWWDESKTLDDAFGLTFTFPYLLTTGSELERYVNPPLKK